MSNETTITPTPEPGTDEESRRRRRMLIIIAVLAILLALIAGAFTWYLMTKKPLSQIPLFSQEIPPGYSSAIYDVSQPLGVALDESNNRIYITQSSGERTTAVFDTEGTRLGSLEAPGKRLAHLPVYVAVDPRTSNVYVTDRAAAAVYVYDSAGNYLSEFKPTGIKKWAPLGITFDKDGELYISDVTDGKQRIWELKTDGTIVRELGQSDDLSFVNGMAVQSDGSLVAADSNSGRVLVFADGNKSAGAISRGQSDAPLGLPRGVAIDDRGRVYVVDTVNHVVRVYLGSDDAANPVPVYSFSFGEEGTGDGGFEFPNGVATDSFGKIYVTDRENNRVQVWSY